MLTAERNSELMQVDAGTPAGELLRRYWWPVAFSRELNDFPVKRVELLGDFFALFKTPSGRLGILPETCPHRHASLAYGMTEEDGLRCSYHGWAFDPEGNCIDQPAERDSTAFRERVKLRAGVVEELGGLVWAYIGPGPAPKLRRFDIFVMPGFRDIGWVDLPCNYVQSLENAVDPHHTEYLHGRYTAFLARTNGVTASAVFQKRHQKISFDEFEHGIIKRRVLEGHSEDDDDWRIGHPLLFPFADRAGLGGGAHLIQIRVPLNLTTTRFYNYILHAPAGIEIEEQTVIPDYELPLYDKSGRFDTSYIEGQDNMTWCTQGALFDRSAEHIGRSDIGLTMLRRMFSEQIEIVAAGGDPIGTVRDAHEQIDLATEVDKFSDGNSFVLEFLNLGASKFSPQIDTIRKLYERA